MNRAGVYGLLLVPFLGCATVQPQVPSGQGSDKELRDGKEAASSNKGASQQAQPVVAMEIKTADASAGGWRIVQPGGTMQSGDKFAINIEVPRQVYVYVALRAGSPAVTWLSPVDPKLAIRGQPDRLTQIPAVSGQWLTLDQSRGPETIFVVVSEQPRDAGALEALLAAEPIAPDVTRRDPPPLVPENRRSLVGDHVLRSSLDTGGVALLRFDYRHI